MPLLKSDEKIDAEAVLDAAVNLEPVERMVPYRGERADLFHDTFTDSFRADGPTPGRPFGVFR